MALSGLNINMGILESDVPDIFGDALAVASTWDPSYYTLSGADVTDIANPGQLGDWDTVNWGSVDVVTDGDGTKWFSDPLSSIANSETCILSNTDEANITARTQGVIEIVSYRAKADQATADSGRAFYNGGFDAQLGNPAKVLWRQIRSTDTAAARYDMETYRQITIGLLPSPFNAGQYQIGHIFDDPAFGAGDYNPDGNTFTTKAYSAGDDIVLCWFFQPTGLRLWINGTEAALRDDQHYNADGTVSDGASAAALLALDWSYYQLDQNGGVAASPVAGRINMGANSKIDYFGLFDGDTTDSEVTQIVSQLLNQKPN